MSLHLKVVTPEKVIFDDKVDKVVVPSKEGELGILPNHASIMASLKPGELKITQGSKRINMAVGEGLLEVSKNNISVLTDLAEKAEDIDVKAIEEAHKRAKIALEDKTLSDEEYATTLATIEKLTAQLHLKRRHHSRNVTGPETVS